MIWLLAASSTSEVSPYQSGEKVGVPGFVTEPDGTVFTRQVFRMAEH